MADDYQDLSQRYYSPEYAEWYRRQMMARFGQEIPAAQAITEGAMSGATSQALLAQQRALGATEAGQAGAGVGGALAARQAAYGGAQQAMGAIGQASGQRADEIAAGRQAELEARMRQLGYSAGLSALDVQRRGLMEQARQGYVQRQMAEDARKRAEAMAIGQGVMGAATSVLGTGAQMGMPSAPNPYGGNPAKGGPGGY